MSGLMSARCILLAALFSLATAAKEADGVASPEARAAPRPPAPIEVEGEVGPVTRLADGRIASVYAVGRPAAKWGDTSIPQKVFGRFSKDGRSWSGPELLLTLPEWPGLLDPYAAPLGTRDGALHYFSLLKHHLDQPIDWRKAYTELVHAISRDGGKTWGEPRKIDWGRRWSGTLIVLPFCYLTSNRVTGLFAVRALLSDDGGETWKTSRNEVTVDSGGKVLESGAIEPAAVELVDGRIWLAIRTQTGYLFESYSADGGETWTPARRTSFRATNCPLNVLRLRSGALLLIWNNEFGEQLFHGVSYSRQSLTMAIDDGKGWRGYRQVNRPFGLDEDPRAVANYPFLAEALDGDVVVSFRERRRPGEVGRFRMLRVDPKWLLEVDAVEDFAGGSANLCLVGTAGPSVATAPAGRPALHLQRTKADRPSGFTWNFPFGRKGSLELRLRIEPGAGGVYFSLSEYQLRPSNREGGAFRWMVDPDLNWRVQYTNDGPYLEEPGPHPNLTLGDICPRAEAGPILDLTVDWDCDTNVARLQQNGRFVATLVGLEPARGIGYVRVHSAAPGVDLKGVWVLGIRSHAEP